jgi:hypothetical protein
MHIRNELLHFLGRTIDQAVSCRLSTAVAQVHTRFWSSGICGRQSGAGAAFFRVLWFPLPIFIPPNSPSSQSPRAGTIGQKWPTCQMDPVWTPLRTMRIKKKYFLFYNNFSTKLEMSSKILTIIEVK